MQPSLGRIVLYTHDDEAIDFCRVAPGTFPGIVTAVHRLTFDADGPDDAVIDLTLFPPGRAPVGLSGVHQAPDNDPTPGRWHWPPRVGA
jgi:hypothetical protein